MLDVKNHDGLLTFLLGMIFLVLAGVGLSLVADRISDSGKARSGILSETEKLGDQILQLKIELKLKRFQLEQSEALKAENLENAALMDLSGEAIRSRTEDLSRLKSSLTASLGREEESFREYRAKARGLAWERSLGDSLGNLRTSDGRMFHDAVVAAVDDKGISIRHSTGTASIPATALPEACWEMFQWERADTMPRPMASGDIANFQNEPPGSSGLEDRGNGPEIGENVTELRVALELAGENVARLAKELRDTEILESRSKSTSVPGSLDTWLERKAQLTGALANAKMKYAKARTNLMIRSPHDPLLGKTLSTR